MVLARAGTFGWTPNRRRCGRADWLERYQRGAGPLIGPCSPALQILGRSDEFAPCPPGCRWPAQPSTVSFTRRLIDVLDAPVPAGPPGRRW
jgi:hypothetical protein